MRVEVHHADGVGYVHVASVQIPETIEDKGPKAALEYAWRWTQNIEASWSRGEEVTGSDRRWHPNPDFNPFVTVIKALPVRDGATWGLRSSMVGDRFVLDGVPYLAASMGFKKEDPQP
jgi:hypothetical protein